MDQCSLLLESKEGAEGNSPACVLFGLSKLRLGRGLLKKLDDSHSDFLLLGMQQYVTMWILVLGYLGNVNRNAVSLSGHEA